MKIWCRKILRVVAVCSAFLFFAFSAQAQLTIDPLDPGPYTPGSSIAATFSIGSTCIKPGNVFNLYLVSSAGVETQIGQYNGFYTTFVNGTIPAATVALPGTGYFLRVKSTSPVYTADSAPFNIVSGGAVLAEVNSAPVLANNIRDGKPEIFGVCSGNGNNRTFNIENISSPNSSVVTGTVRKEVDPQNTANLTFNSIQIASFVAEASHYTMLIKASLNGTVATRAYFLLNNTTTIAFITNSNDVVCLPTKLSYGVASEQLKRNFPGDIYTINWGDGSSTSYTLCDIINNANIVDHLYEKSSCGSTFGGVNNAFGIVISAKNDFCPSIGTPVSTTAKVVTKPLNSFTFGNPGCKATDITFTNTSITGENPNSGNGACKPNNVKYTWSVDGDVKAFNKDVNFNFVWNFTGKGPHTITLTSTNTDGACDADPYTATICIQDPPKPAFSFPSSIVCTQAVVKPKDESIIDPTCNASNIYTWSVSPATGVSIDDIHAKEPNITFSNPGNYTVTLSISTTSCGIFISNQTIAVNTKPTASLSLATKLCNLSTYDFNPTTSGPTKTTLTGTTVGNANTYLWTVTGGNSSFVNSTANSQYPSIKFEEYKEYIITVTHTNDCGTATVSQKLTFITAPEVRAGQDETICFNTTNVQLAGSVDGSFTDNSSIWIGGGGRFLPSRNVLNPTYEPTNAERLAGRVNLILRKSTGLTDACATVDDEIVINIDPAINITSAATKTICSATAVDYTPTSNPPGATYTWSATGTANASGYSISGTGIINDIVTNSDPSADATVTYTIVPRLRNCDGAPFTFTVTIKAKSVGGTTTASNNDVCAGANGGNISLSGNIGNIIRWESSIDGQNWTAISTIANPYVFSNLNQTTQFRAVVKNSVCDEVLSLPVTVTVNAAIPDATVGDNQSLCGDNATSLSANKVDAPYSGKWTLVSSQKGVLIVDATLFNTIVSGLVAGETYRFRWTISGAATCDPKFAETTVTVYRPLTNTITTAATEVCAGQSIIITGDTPTGGNGTYAYQWQVSADGTTWSDISGQTSKDLNIQITASSSYRRVVNSNPCTLTSEAIKITVLQVIGNNNIITADQTICSGTAPLALNGTVPINGNGTYFYQWESSSDNGNTWINVDGATELNFTPPIPTSTILYRRLVASGTCSDLSNSVKITVNPPAKAEFTFTVDKGCPPFTLTPAIIKAIPYPDRNGTYTWFADGNPIGTGINFPGYTITEENRSVVIKLVVTSSLGCNSGEFSHTFSTQQNVIAAFTQSATQGCGPLTVNFTNTSNSLTESSFKWDFGNGTTSNQAQPGPVTFQYDPTGKDITYTITLSAITPCGTTTKTATVFVQGKPKSIFSPDKTTGCSPLTVNFSNTSPESSGTTYTFDFNDGSPLLVTNNRNSVSHLFTTLVVRDYVVTMTAENACGKSSSSYTLRVAPNDITPELVVNAGELSGCAPFTVNFYNNTKGASRFAYDFGDETGLQITNSAPETVSHIFTKPGTYTVTLYATNDCSNAQTTETITVLTQPTVEFTADKTAICDGGLVKFRNTSKNAIGYAWDFGDGTTSFAFEPEHVYTGAGQNFTVKLTTTNALGCTNTLILTDYIKVAPELKSIFTVLPGNELSIPNFTFSFRDASLNGAGSWEWNFGDGTVSTLQNPTHTYANVGDYTITLKVLNKEGCSATSSQAVRIIGVPGFLYVPNSFMPGSAKNELQTFKAKGRGIYNWTMTIFNKWGQVLWETTKLDDGAPLESWDGTYKGQPQPQGVYFWKIEVKFINGSEWKGMTYDSSPPKKTGNIYLIR